MALFGLRYDLRSGVADHSDLPGQYAAALEQCEWADRLGFASVTISEHHGAADGYLPAPLPFAAAIAARTQNLRIVIGALIAPLYEPLRLAEDLAVLSNLSNNRVIPVLAAGYVESEFRALGRSLRDRKRVMDALPGVLRKAWTGEPFEYEDRIVRVTPRPLTPPPIWMGGSTEAAACRAAREAENFIPSTPDIHDAYRQECQRLGRTDPGPLRRSLGNFLHLARDPDAAWSRIAPYLLRENNAYAAWASEQGVATPYQACKDTDELRATGRYPVMRPEQLVERAGALGPWDSVLFHPLAGGLPAEFAWESLRLFESDVLPALNPVGGAG